MRKLPIVAWGLALIAWEAGVFCYWRGNLPLVPARTTKRDRLTNIRWDESLKQVVMWRTGHTNGGESDPHPAGPLQTLDPRTGELETLVAGNVADLRDSPDILSRFSGLFPGENGLHVLTEIQGENADYTVYNRRPVDLFSLALPPSNPKLMLRYGELNELLVNAQLHSLKLWDRKRRRDVGVIYSSAMNEQPKAIFPEGGLGFVVIHTHQIQWFDLPPKQDRSPLARWAIGPPLVVLACLRLWRVNRRLREACASEKFSGA